MLRLGVVPDFREEEWLSMNLVADRLLEEIGAGHAGDVRVGSLCPPYRKRFARLPFLGAGRTAINADRMLNRMRVYPQHLRMVARSFDCFHVCDHAYSNVVHALPAERTGVFCHDLDTFGCLLQPEKERRPGWFKAMMRRVLSGMEKAAVVFHTTAEIRRQILAHGIVDESRLVRAPLGVSAHFSAEESADDGANATLKMVGGRRYILHVGSCIARKRIDVLLNVFAGIRARHPDVVLVKVGGPLTPEQEELRARLKLGSSMIVADRQDERELAVLYRHAAIVVQPSDAEGFGLPVAEALASGSVVVASAIPTLMEVGGPAAVYCAAGAVDEWVGKLTELLRDPSLAPDSAARRAQAAKYSWANYARTICDAYRLIGVTG